MYELTQGDYKRAERYARRVAKAANALHWREDITQEAFMALTLAARRYDPVKNDSFWGYATRVVWGSCVNAVRAITHTQRACVGDRMPPVIVQFDFLRNKFDPVPMVRARDRPVGSITMTVHNRGALNEWTINLVTQAMGRIKERYSRVLRSHYLDGVSLPDLARREGLNLSSMYRLKCDALNSLRKELGRATGSEANSR